MKIKFWWVQHIPIIGLFFIIHRWNTYTWKNKFSNKKYLGDSFDYWLSAIIQALSITAVILFLFFKLFKFLIEFV